MKREKVKRSADLALTAKDLFKEMMEDISDPGNFREWTKKYNLESDLEAELKKIVAHEITKRNKENA